MTHTNPQAGRVLRATYLQDLNRSHGYDFNVDAGESTTHPFFSEGDQGILEGRYTISAHWCEVWFRVLFGVTNIDPGPSGNWTLKLPFPFDPARHDSDAQWGTGDPVGFGRLIDVSAAVNTSLIGFQPVSVFSGQELGEVYAFYPTVPSTGGPSLVDGDIITWAAGDALVGSVGYFVDPESLS